MRPPLLLVGSLIVGVAMATLVTNTYANGRKLPVQLDIIPVSATCQDDMGVKHQFSRAQIGSNGGTASALEARIGAAESQLPLIRIKRLIFDIEKATVEGFAKAMVQLDNGSEGAYLLKVEDQGKTLYLVGPNPQGISLKIPVSKCNTLEFSPLVQQDTSSERPLRRGTQSR
jgi:hypothetical protein